MSFKLVFIRHEKPFYKDEGHDLTPEGVEKSIKLGSFLVETGVIDKSNKILLLHSPKPRAKGTLEFIKIGAKLDFPMEEVSELRSSDFKDLDAFLSRKKDLGFSTEQLAKEHFTNEIYFNQSPHIIETNDSKRKRLYVFLANLIQRFESSNGAFTQVVAVSHFEIIMHLINDVFGIENFDTYLTPGLGEFLEIEISKTENINIAKLKIRFRNDSSEVYFDSLERLVYKSRLL